MSVRQYDSDNLLVHPGGLTDPRVIVEVTPERAGWDTISFQAVRLEGGSWSFSAGHSEMALVVLGGTVDVASSRGGWSALGTRENVFAGPPSALYLPRGTDLTVTATSGPAEFAAARVPAEVDGAPRRVDPEDIEVEVRGGGHATRQINRIMPPGFPSGRLVVVEVYTPGGNWSSYPPHKHDVHRAGEGGALLEADLDEIYYYRLDRPEGYALQRVYTGPDSPLQRAGLPIDAAVVARDNDVVLVPEGYHPVSSPVGYTTYYLNVLAGSAQSLAASDDPDYAWVKGCMGEPDPRVPLYDVPGRLVHG